MRNPHANPLDTVMKLAARLTTAPPQEAKVTIGLDIGSTAIKALALGARKGGGGRQILGQHSVPLELGQETDASDAVRSAVAALHVPVRTVNLSVSGPWVIIRIVEMPTMKPTEIRQALPFEAQRYLPFNIQDVIIDGAVLGTVDAHRSWVLVVACKKELIERRVDWVRRAGLGVALIDVDALAVANGFLAGSNGHRPEGTRAVINVGAQMTNLVIFQGETPYLVRDIPWGGDKLARSASEQMGIDLAEVLKDLGRAEVGPDTLNAIKLSSEILVTELQLSFDYFENRFGQPPEEILDSGGLSACQPFIGALKSHLTQTVIPWVPVKGLPPQFAVAYGLALRTS